MPEMYYSREEYSAATEVRFFNKALGESGVDEFDTNMLQKSKFTDFTFRVTKIKLLLPPNVSKSDLETFFKEALIVFKLAQGSENYVPAWLALANVDISQYQYTEPGSSGTDTHYFSAAKREADGHPVDWVIPANVTFEIYLKTETSATLGVVTMIIEGERA